MPARVKDVGDEEPASDAARTSVQTGEASEGTGRRPQGHLSARARDGGGGRTVTNRASEGEVGHRSFGFSEGVRV